MKSFESASFRIRFFIRFRVTAFVAARRLSRRDEAVIRKDSSERHTCERLHAAVARLSTSRTFTTPEHLAALASLRHSPCVPIQDAAKALFRANAEDGDAREDRDLSHLAESARAAVAAAEASLASEADAVRLFRTGAGPEASRGASRKAEALAEEAVRLAAPAVVAAVSDFSKRKKTATVSETGSETTPRSRCLSSLVRALVALLAAPHAVLVADAASLLAEGVESNGWSNALSETELVSLQTETFALADAFGGIGGLYAHTTRSFVASRGVSETMAARDATHALLAALASEHPASFVAHLARRLARAPAESPAHMAAFLALASVAREKPRALEKNLDAVAAVVAAASSASTPALRKACRAGARALAADLAQHSGRAAYFASKDAERLAVAAEDFSIHVYDLVVGAKVRTLREEDDEAIAAADESGAAAAAAASVMHAANELSGAFSGFSLSRALASPASDTPETKQSRNANATTPVRRSVDVIPSPDDADGNQRYAAAAAAAAMAIAANGASGGTAQRSQRSRRNTPRASPRASPRVSLNATSPRRDDRTVGFGSVPVGFPSVPVEYPTFALAFDDDGARLAGYRDAKRASRVRIWHVSTNSLFSRPSAFANLASLGARVSGAVAGAGASGGGHVSSAGFGTVVGCAESFLCGDTAEMAEMTFQDAQRTDDEVLRGEVRRGNREGTAERRSVTLEWRGGGGVVLRRGNVEAAFGVKA